MATTKTIPTAERLRALIAQRHPDNSMAYADLFAVGCLLHAQGHERAGRNLIDQVTGAVKALGNQTYLRELCDGLAGSEFAYARDIHAHHEVNELLDQERRRQAAFRAGSAASDAGHAMVTSDAELAAARQWRTRWGYVGRGGVVVLFDGEVQGWVGTLRPAGHWQPGCLAVDEDGRSWITIGRSAHDSGLMWLPNDPLPE